MSTMSTSPGGAAPSGIYSHQNASHHHHSAASAHQHQQHHPHHLSPQEPQGGNHSGMASGLAHSSFDSVNSHHGSQQHHTSSPNPNNSSSSWGSHPLHYTSSSNNTAGSAASAAGNNASAYMGNSSSNGNSAGGTANGNGAHGMYSAGSGGGGAGYYSGYSAYSVQPHQNQSHSHQPMYASHAGTGAGAAGAAANGTSHHSGTSTPTSVPTSYGHHASHPSSGGMYSAQGYNQHHQQQTQASQQQPQQQGYYAQHSSAATANGQMQSSPSYASAPQYSTQLPLAGRHRVTTTLWEDEGTLCFQVDARGVCVARRHDNNMINGTKLLNVCGMSRGKRDGILKNEKERVVVKVGAMHLKGVWITFQRGKQLAEQNDITDALYPLFETNIQSFLYHPDNYPRTAAVMAAAQERHAQRARGPVSNEGQSNYMPGQRATSHSSGPMGVAGHHHQQQQQQNPPPLMRANTTPNGQMLTTSNGAGTAYHHSNGYPAAQSHSQQHSPYGPPSHNVSGYGSGGAVSAATGGFGAGSLAAGSPYGNVQGNDIYHRALPLHNSQQPNMSHGYGLNGGVMLKQRSPISLKRDSSAIHDEL